MFRWTSAFGEQQSLHVSGALKSTCALQRFASRRTVGHGPRLLQRGQRLDMQVLLGPSLGFPLVHSKRLGVGIVIRLFGAGRWNRNLLWVRDRRPPAGNQIAGLPLPILEVPDEQREAYR